MSEGAATHWGGSSFWRTGHGRLLLSLALLALVTTAAAIVVVMSDARRTAPRFSPALVFPALEAKFGDAAIITVASPEGTIEVRRAEGGDWVVPSASNYPAHMGSVRKMLLGLASLKAVEARTARRDWLETLDLIAPGQGGKATEIRVSDAKSKLIAGLLVGKLSPASGHAGEDAFYVRRVNEDQTYLAEGNLPLDVARSDWLDPAIVEVPRDRVFRVTLRSQEGPSFSISRASPEVQNFSLDAMPRGRSMVSETAANPIGAALSDFTLEDVRPQTELDLRKATRAVFETFDGLVITVNTAEVKGEHWVRVSAEAKAPPIPHTGPKAHNVADEASVINSRVAPWAYKIADWKAALFSRSLASLLAEPEKASKPSTPQ